MSHHDEAEFRRRHAEQQLRVDAMDWLNKAASNVPRGHADACHYNDDTGWPAPCNCGFSTNKDVRIVALLKTLLMKE